MEPAENAFGTEYASSRNCVMMFLRMACCMKKGGKDEIIKAFGVGFPRLPSTGMSLVETVTLPPLAIPSCPLPGDKE